MDIKETAEIVHANAVNKGFWEREVNVGELLMLVTSELGEALEALRKNRMADYPAFEQRLAEVIASMPIELQQNAEEAQKIFINLFQSRIKDTFQDEIADAVIRLFDLSEGLGIDLEAHIKAKMRYNATRERLHGKKF